MKKVLLTLTCLVCVFALLCFAGCSQNPDESTENQNTTVEANGENISEEKSETDKDETQAEQTNNCTSTDESQISFLSDKTEVNAGGEFSVTCVVNKCDYFAAGDLIVEFNDDMLDVEAEEKGVATLYSFSDINNGEYKYSAYVTTTIDLQNVELFSLNFTVDENCKPGEELEITLICDDWLVGTTASGSVTESLTDSINSQTVKVTVN